MALGHVWPLSVAENSQLEDGLKEEKLYQHKMIKLESLKKSDHFKLVLKGKKNHTDYFSMFATKNFFNIKKNNLLNAMAVGLFKKNKIFY